MDMSVDWSRPAILQHLSQHQQHELMEWKPRAERRRLGLLIPPITFDTREPKLIGSAVNSSVANSGTTVTQAATIPAGCTAMVITCTGRGATPFRFIGCTFNSIAASQVASSFGSATSDTHTTMFVYYDPPVGTTANVVATTGVTIIGAMVSIRYLSGVNACEAFSEATPVTTAAVLSTTLTSRVSSIVIQSAHLVYSAGTGALSNIDEGSSTASSVIQILNGSKRFRRPFSVAQTFSHSGGTRNSNAAYPSLFVACAFRWRNSAITARHKGYYTSTTGATPGTSHSFTVDIDKAPHRTEDRLIFVQFIVRGAGAIPTLSAVTVNGSAMVEARAVETTALTADIGISIWTLKLNTGAGNVTLAATSSAATVLQAHVSVLYNAFAFAGAASSADSGTHASPFPTADVGASRRNRSKLLGAVAISGLTGTALTLSDDQTPDVTQAVDSADHPYTTSPTRSLVFESIGNFSGNLAAFGAIRTAHAAGGTQASVLALAVIVP